ncbi:hypothetical protein NNJEOMEG_01228 [Fundidesulfovibrio magnetotacticus]|uniref:EamA domain-containing protein n=1 Tax=Fundidesulfovibrio magnetotacticus TaxID=2730080 RepID=A0A6V8LUB1_9BACT|nr:DMT family transporter [Fundidesulfovibrio magnetotacticus]GFK93396.1 hypothetical protein NNJEOMEG_01228 [Fundidesulfovibrio magnetotacticus]
MRKGYLTGLTVVGFWAAFMLVSRLGLAGPTALSPWDILALRLAAASLTLAPFCGGLGREVWGSWRVWTLAALGGPAYGLTVYWGFRLAPATHGALLFPGVLPFAAAFLGWALLGARPGAAQWRGLGLVALGLACLSWVSWSGGAGEGVRAGDALFLAAALSWALYGVLARRWGVAAWTLTRAAAVCAAALYLPVYALWLPKGLAGAGWPELAGQALYHGVVTTVLVMWLYLRAQESLGPARMGALMALVPAVSGGLAALLLGEELPPALAVGLASVSAGAWLASGAAKPSTGRSVPCPT